MRRAAFLCLLLVGACRHATAPAASPYTGPCTIHAKYFLQNPNGTWGTVSFDWIMDECPAQVTISLPDGERSLYGRHP